MISRDRLMDALDYNPDTGVFIWRNPSANCMKKGDVAGSQSKSGYRHVMVDGTLYKEHRLAWFYMTGFWPVEFIDHVNGIKDDNRFSNLREANRSQNGFNIKKQRNNKSGFKGVSWCNTYKKWVTVATKDGKCKFLGYFNTAEKAHEAYVQWAEKNAGEYMRVD